MEDESKKEMKKGILGNVRLYTYVFMNALLTIKLFSFY